MIDTDKEGNELTLIDVIASEDTIVDAIDKKFKIEHMLKGINTVLDDREKKIIILRYGLNNCYPKSQQDTADLLGISRSYVSRIEKKSIGETAQTISRSAAFMNLQAGETFTGLFSFCEKCDILEKNRGRGRSWGWTM